MSIDYESERILLDEMVKLRQWLQRNRWILRVLIAVVVVLVLLVFLFWRDDQKLNDQAEKGEADRARLQQTIDAQQAQRDANLASVCNSDSDLINAYISLLPPPANVTVQYVEQARLDNFERQFERELAPLGCDLHLVPVKSPPPPAGPSEPGAAENTQPSQTVGTPSPPSSTPVPPLVAGPSAVVNGETFTNVTRPGNGPPATTPGATTPTLPNGKPKPGNPNPPGLGKKAPNVNSTTVPKHPKKPKG